MGFKQILKSLYLETFIVHFTKRDHVVTFTKTEMRFTIKKGTKQFLLVCMITQFCIKIFYIF